MRTRRRPNLRRPALLLAVVPAALLAALPLNPTSALEPGTPGTTVPAPGAGDGATVTVSRTTDLVNQTVLVSWTGFRPSTSTRLDNSGDALDVNTENPVRVYQCRGADPASSSDCYGSPGFRGIGETDTHPAVDPVPAFTYPGQTDPYAATPDGPANWQDNVTRADGTGEVAIQLFTRRESAGLGCDVSTPCSIVVVPNYGRPQGATEDMLDAPWAWDRRTVVPLEFLPVDDACPLTGEGLGVEGSPVAAHVLASWRARTCVLSSDAVRVDYTSIGEPQTRNDVASGVSEVGLVIDPLEAEAAAGQGVVYSPVTVTGLVVAFQIDDSTGRPVEHLNLNPRLVAKLITASYRSGGNPAVIDNPVNLFRDPEFLDLNPGVSWPGGAPGNHPLLLGDLSDTTLALTRWIAADKDAKAFLAGKPDPWGMTVNANYKAVPVPFASFPLLDPAMSSTFEPVQELDALARQLSIARFPGALTTVEGGVTVVTKPPRQNPGRREVIGIIDAAAASRFRLATASLRNAGGAFVAPSVDSMQTAIDHASVNPDGVTRTVDLTDKDKGIYPLTLQISAALSTKADQATRTQMADLLTYVAGDGQVLGEQVGLLPEGHAPLTPALRKQVTAARTQVLAGWTEPEPEDPEEPAGTPAGSSGGGVGGGVIGGGGAPVVPTSPEAPPGAGTVDDGRQPTDEVVEAALIPVNGEPVGERSLVLPMLGLLALVALVGGPLLLWLERNGRGPAWLRR